MYSQRLLIVITDRLNTAVHKTVIAAIAPPYLKADVAGDILFFGFAVGSIGYPVGRVFPLNLKLKPQEG